MNILIRAALIAGVTILPAWSAWAATAEYVGTYVWRNSEDWFGGLSGIEVEADGLHFTAINDRGVLLRGTLDRDAAGQVNGVTVTERVALLDNNFRVLDGSRSDSEGLVVDDAGHIFLSFEGRVRVRAQDSLTSQATLMPDYPDFDRMQDNGALEALAVAADGTLYTIPERSGRPDWDFPVYRLRNGTWDVPFAIPRTDAFLNSGADIGPDGKLYVLQRDFTGIGFRTRVLRFGLEGEGAEVILETANGAHDNLEGISVWRAPDGLRITMISDNNFRFFLQTQIVEYRIPG